MPSTKQVRSARVLVWQGDSLLVQTDTRLSDADQYYRLPGGHMELSENPAACARREFAEEMGIPIEIGPLCYVGWNVYTRKGKKIQEIVFYFCARVAMELPCTVSTLEPHLHASMTPRNELADSRCLPPNLFARAIADGPAGPGEVVYVQEQ